MAGGIMNLVSEGQANVILNGNPSKTFFKSSFAQYTNFGLQKFRIDFEGSKSLRLTEESTFTFKIKRYADLLMDCYLSMELPNIWSPIQPPPVDETDPDTMGKWAPYEFKWIENLGAKMIAKISITCGNYTLQTYSGDFLLAQVQRDFSTSKKHLFDKMIGNTPVINDPANAELRQGVYPNAYYSSDAPGPEPSIRGTTLYVPLNNWFGLKSQMAFPLVSLQYNELNIVVTMRPINQLFQIRDVMDEANNYPYIAPNFNTYYMQMHRFLQAPPDLALGPTSYIDTRGVWNADIHLNCTYGFLSNDESRVFALEPQNYLIKQVHETIFHNVTGSNRVSLDSLGMVADWLFYFQRSDVNLRNEWSNYTNWLYTDVLPDNVVAASDTGDYTIDITDPMGGGIIQRDIGPGINPDGTATNIAITPAYNPANERLILVALGILLDGSYRENVQPSGVFNFIEKYTRTAGNGPNGLYCYNFCLNTSPFDLQPSGAINMSRFNQIELEFTTINPPLDPLAQSLVICDPESGGVIGINKPSWRIYDYNFDLYLFEESINFVNFMGGNVGMMYAT